MHEEENKMSTTCDITPNMPRLLCIAEGHRASPDKVLHIAVSAAVQGTCCMQEDCARTGIAIMIMACMVSPKPVSFINHKQRACHGDSSPVVNFSTYKAKQFFVTKFKWV